MAVSKKEKFIYAVGRRKTASARIRLFKGSHQSTINDLPIEKYFPGKINLSYWTKPFELSKTLGKYYASIKVSGGGRKGQLEAAVHGLAKALSLADPEKFRPDLKKAGLLTRDSRERERRKIGTGGKARRKKQSPKR